MTKPQTMPQVDSLIHPQNDDLIPEATIATEVAFALPDVSFTATPQHLDEIELVRNSFSLPSPIVEASAELLVELGQVPNKMAFKIGEAAVIVGVKQYVLRYWETEFEVLRPRKSKNNQRVYSRRDVETALMIKKLLYQDRFSIEGARSAMRQLKIHVKDDKRMKAMAASQETAVTKLRGLVTEIQRIRDIFL